MAKYLNKKKVLVEADERKCQKAADQDLFGYLYKRKRVRKLFFFFSTIAQVMDFRKIVPPWMD